MLEVGDDMMQEVREIGKAAAQKEKAGNSRTGKRDGTEGGTKVREHIRIHKTEPNQGSLNYSHLLDAPAGKRGFVTARKGHLYFEDGTRARFFGFNVAARSNTPDHETADKLAERFASMGVNIVRLHAADAPMGEEAGSWSSCRETPLLHYGAGTSREFGEEGLERFDYFTARLKERGIYLHIDLIVAREFVPGDGLDYPGKVPSCMKRYCMYNERLIQLQKEYAKALLCHVNPYTGLALIDDPAVVTIQINNEDSAIKGNMGGDAGEEMSLYRKEVQERFNHFLLMKYHTRERLREAWTHEGFCALREDEDPAEGSVRGIEGSFYQPLNDPADQWDKEESPARYADFMEFGIYTNRRFYREMKDYLRSLGVRVPIVTSNLIAGAADVYGHTDGDLMENNSYFNHPLLPVRDNTYLVAGPVEYVSANPLTMQKGVGAMSTTLLSLASVAIVKGKPFMLSEWNEYGEHPFHSTSLVQTVAYACLNDWDGLILYNHHTSENWDDQPADEIRNIFDVYNDPAVICQWGFMASLFLKGLVSAAQRCVDIVYTQNDLRTLPEFHSMPMMFFPYITAVRNVFLDGGEIYQGDADVAVNAGFLNGADLSAAQRGVYYAWSEYRDAMRRCRDGYRLKAAAAGARELEHGVYLGESALVFDQIRETACGGDYRKFAEIMDFAMKEWGVMPQETGYVDGVLVSDTGEIRFDPEYARFQIRTPYCGYFSGAPQEWIDLSDKVRIRSENGRITAALIARNEEALEGAEEYILTVMGETGMDGTTYEPGMEFMGSSFTAVKFMGKLYAETLQGSIAVKARSARLESLSPVGEVLAQVKGEQRGEEVVFTLDGGVPGIQYRITL
ncbi:MAG: beta-galactosidase [Eubacteriales bacterium]|nr:beta-galactosidase [Eubacteriales bacterium]